MRTLGIGLCTGEKAVIYVLAPELTLHDLEPVIVIVVCGTPLFAPYQSLYSLVSSMTFRAPVAVDSHFECPMYKAFWISFVAESNRYFLSGGQVLLLALLTHINRLYHCNRITRRMVRMIN